MTGCAGLGLEGLELSSAGVDGAFDSGGNWDNSCGSNCFDNGHDWLSNWDDCFDNWYDWLCNCNFNRCFGDGHYLLRGCPGGCQETNNKELKEIKTKVDAEK